MNDAECQLHNIQWSSAEIGTACPACMAEEKNDDLQQRIVALEAERYIYMDRTGRLESIIRAAKSGNYDNAHEINAIRKFLYDAMREYEAALSGAERAK